MKTFTVELPITEKELVSSYRKHVMEMTKGKKTAAARILGINRRTLYRRIAGDSPVAKDAHLQTEFGIYD